MAKKFKQFRYYGDRSSKNIPAYQSDEEQGFTKSTIALEDFINPDTGKSYFPIYKLGIQGLPGTKFYINNNDAGVLINNTGIFELDLKDNIVINSLLIDPQSLKNIDNNKNSCLLIDIIYED